MTALVVLSNLLLFTGILLLSLLVLPSSFAFQSVVVVISRPNSNYRPSPIVVMGVGSSSELSDITKQTFQNKSILLTGASRGLGKSLAYALSTCEPSLLILSGRDEDALTKVKEECMQIQIANNNINNKPTQVEIIPCDLSNKESVEQLANKSLQFSNCNCIDILINNGGISSRSSFLETKLNVDEQLLQVNFVSGASLAKTLVPQMVTSNDGGKVIWISSIQGKLGTPYRTSYAASKFAVQGYCEALRSELASSNVSVHIVSPGYIRTNLSLSAVMGDGKAYSKMDDTTANGANPDEVASEILNSVAVGKKSDFVVAATVSAKLGLWLKFIAPSFLEKMLVKRYEKGQIVDAKKE